MVKRIYIFIIALLAALASSAATADTETGVFDERIRTLQVKHADEPYASVGLPVLVTPDDVLEISFDILGDDREYLRYDLTHCNADWQPSQLSWGEYLDGFNEGAIDDYEFSRATSVHYVHYSLTIPNDVVRPTVSGNYLLRIYEENDPETAILQVRFAVSEQTAGVGATLKTATDVDYNRTHQQLAVSVATKPGAVRDIFNDLIVVIEQNGRPDTRRIITKPMRVSGSTAYYEHNADLIFKAGNEYRRFEATSTHYPGMGVDHIEFISPYYHTVLEADASRAAESHHADRTLHGAFVVREYNSANSDIEADYGIVHFTLEYPELPGYDIFIDSDATQRRFSPESRMVYDRASGTYHRAMLLKQGAYSYQYLAVKNGTDQGLTSIIEGDKYETSNIYTINVYERRPGERYDRLIGSTIISYD